MKRSFSDLRKECRRPLVRLISRSENCIDLIGLLLLSVFFFRLVPSEVFGPQPATGGDMGSHFWPLYTLVHHGLPHGFLRLWNPGNLAGEPLLVHYFPLPFLLMACLSFFMPLGTAFNIGTLLPLFTFPIAVYTGIRLMGYRFPAPLLSAAASVLFLYNESYSIWGGNGLSVLSGQFAHLYALNFLFLGMGFLAREIRLNRFPFGSAMAIAAVLVSHGYVVVGLPAVYLAFALLWRQATWPVRLQRLLQSGIIALLVSLWFLVPMLDNAKWTMPVFFSWRSESFLAEAMPPIFYPLLIILDLCLLIFLACEIAYPLFMFIRHRRMPHRYSRQRFVVTVLFFTCLSLVYLGYYFVFEQLGLVDIRALPQVQLFLSVLAALLLSFLLRRRRIVAYLLTLPLICLSLWWADLFAVKFPQWAKWNYSGIEAKPAYAELKSLTEAVRGNLSMPRIAVEHSELNNRAGTTRVFEMLPYYANRATMESVYLEASILSPAALLLQSEISKTPSCPFSQFDCLKLNIAESEARLRLLGVGGLILVSDEAVEQASKAEFLQSKGIYGDWHLFMLKEQPSLVDVFREPIVPSTDMRWGQYTQKVPQQSDWNVTHRVPIDPADWKHRFYQWLLHYKPGDPFLIAEDVPTPRAGAKMLQSAAPSDKKLEECSPTVQFDFRSIKLKTNCPGAFHYIKVAYHSSWKADSGDALYLVSPGFIAINPSRPEVTLTFGRSMSWVIAGWISTLTLIVLAIRVVRSRRC